MTTPRALVAGEALVDLFPTDGAPVEAAETFERRAGGAPANVAVAMARLDTPPWLWTSVGDDGPGDYLRATLADAGVPDRFVDRSDRPTALALVGSDASGDPAFSLYLEGTAAADLSGDRVPEDALDAVEWVHFGGTLLAVESARTATFALVEAARDAGCTVSFDPNTRPSTWRDGADLAATLDRALRLSDVVLASPDDFRPVDFPGDAERLAAALRDRGPHTAVTTLGAEGALAVSGPDAPWGRTRVRHPGFAVDAVDPTGAGDAFAAATVAELLDGAALADAVAVGNAAGALTATATGATTALPDREAIRRLLDG